MTAKTIAGISLDDDRVFAIACAVVYAIIVLVTPPYNPLIDTDTPSYVGFNPMRSVFYPLFVRLFTTIGFGLLQITWVQLVIFSGALAYFLIVLARNGFPRWLLAILVLAMAGNVLFSSFHRSILSESVYFSLTLIAVAQWIDYLRTGHAMRLFWAGIALGLMIGIRLAGVSLVPLHVLAIWLTRPRGTSVWKALVLAVVPIVICIGAERLLYHAVYGNSTVSQAGYLLTGKAALLVQPNMNFSGPYAPVLEPIAAKLYEIYEPARRALDGAPSIGVRAQLSANYEGLGQIGMLASELAAAATREHTTTDTLRLELGKQAIWQNLSGYLRLTALNNFGQWSVAAQHFPPISRGLAAYADTNPAVSFDGRMPYDLLHPAPTTVGLIVYPAFLLVGAVTLLLAVGLLFFIVQPDRATGPEAFYLLVATYLSAMCHVYTLFTALVNVWTPRFLMAVFPQIEIIGLCLILVVGHRCRLLALPAPNTKAA
jgi:hypothetical protein